MTNYTLIRGMKHDVVTEVLLEQVIAMGGLHRPPPFPSPSRGKGQGGGDVTLFIALVLVEK